MKKVLITGGTGFIGSKICAECENQGIEYLALYNRARSVIRNSRQVNLQNPDAVRQALADYQPDAVIHLAAIASPIHSDISEIYRINVGGTENLLQAMAEIVPGARLLLTSTAGVYGNQDIPLLHERLQYNPTNHYSCSKMVTEIMSRQFSDCLNITIMRPFNVIGTGQSEHFFIPKLVRSFATHVPEIRIGNLQPVRDYVSVDFCAHVMLKLACMTENTPDILNICSGIGFSCEQVIELLEELTDEHPIIISDADLSRRNEVWRMVGDSTRLKSIVNSEYVTTPLRDLLTAMLQQYQDK